MKVLLDHDLPKKLRLHIRGHLVLTARQMGWESLQNGDLIAAAESAEFDVLITADKKMFYQQNNANRRIAIVMLTNPMMVSIRPVIESVIVAVDQSSIGGYKVVNVSSPPKRQRQMPNV